MVPRVVTLNGETISRDGNLAVSSEARQGSTRFDFSELETTKRRLEVGMEPWNGRAWDVLFQI